MNITIKKVQPGDEDILAYIQTESWKTAFLDILDHETLRKLTNRDKARTMYKRLLDEQIGNGYILRINGRPHCIAWWDTTRETDMPDCAELICIHSLPDNWGKGFGSKMMETVLKDISYAGFEKVMLWVFDKNIRARKFYEKFGFSVQKKTKQFLDQTEVCYEKVLHK